MDGKLDVEIFYDKVYDVERLEIFFKFIVVWIVGLNEVVMLCSDFIWQILEFELGLVFVVDGSIVGYIVGNDMSCCDIEGENFFYLLQVKMWKYFCFIGLVIFFIEFVKDLYDFDIICCIYCYGNFVVEGIVSIC